MKCEPRAAAPGLTSLEAVRRLQQYGPNEAAEERRHPGRAMLGKLWAPVPWMLEIVIVLQLLLGRYVEAAVIAVLLVFNVVLGFVQENRASNALALLRRRLTVQARVLRDGRWQLLAARELVPGDVIHLRMGDLVADSRQLVRDLNDLGVRVIMVTGDSPATARTVARQVGIGESVCPPEQLRHELDANAPDCEVFAGVLPEDKYRLVRAFQRQEHTVGMTGDGVNDAPALKQAEVGIAVASAADVAKAAASLVLTNPGLGDIVAAVQTSRRIYQRMLTYTLNKIVKTIEIALLLSLGLLFTGTFVTTPVLIVLLLFTNDFVTMSLATDRVSFSRTPDHWHIRSLVLTALPLAILILALSFGLFLWGRDVLRLSPRQLQTLIFVLLVFSGQGTVYLVRERRHCWQSRPSGWLLASSLLDMLVVIVLAASGIFMEPLPLSLLLEVLGLVVLYLLALDFLKVRIVRAFQV